MPYVERNQQGKVVGRYGCAQPGYAEEWLDDNHPDLQPTAEEVAEAAAKAAEKAARDQLRIDAKATAMFAALQSATLAQIDAWVDSNFSGMTAQQRSLLKLLAAVAGMYLRER